MSRKGSKKVSTRKSPKKRSTRRKSTVRSGLVCYKNKNKSITCYKKKSAKKSVRKSAQKVVYKYVYPKQQPLAMQPLAMQIPMNNHDNAQVYGCTRHLSESGCGYDPSCSWGDSGCRRKVGVLAGRKFQGPMGPA
jgi:hypothetical protein